MGLLAEELGRFSRSYLLPNCIETQKSCHVRNLQLHMPPSKQSAQSPQEWIQYLYISLSELGDTASQPTLEKGSTQCILCAIGCPFERKETG